MSFQNSPSKILWHFLGSLDRIYGLHIDATLAMADKSQGYEKFVDQQSADINKGIFFGDGAPNRDESTYRHYASFRELIERNKPNGPNHVLLINSCIIYIYTIWDTSVRSRYAEELGLEQSEIVCGVLGDLRHYRNAILHHSGILQKKTKTLNFVSSGARIELSNVQFRDIMALLFDELCQLNEQHTGEKLNLRFERRLNPKGEQPSS